MRKDEAALSWLAAFQQCLIIDIAVTSNIKEETIKEYLAKATKLLARSALRLRISASRSYGSLEREHVLDW
jgi:hypothetical protein